MTSTTTSKLMVDLTGIKSVSTQATVKAAIHDTGCPVRTFHRFWPALMEGKAEELPDRPLIVADLSSIAKNYCSTDRHLWTQAVRNSGAYFLVLVRNKTDERHAALVDDLMKASDSRMLVCSFLTSNFDAHFNSCVSHAVSSLDPDAILAVRYSPADKTMWCEFSDGLIGSVPWAALDPRGEQLSPETATPSDDFQSIEVLNSDGSVIHIDSAAIRLLLDPSLKSKVQAQAEESAAEVGQRIKRVRESAGLTQVELARQTGLEQALISKLERGRHQPRFDTIERIATGLGISVAGLLADDNVT